MRKIAFILSFLFAFNAVYATRTLFNDNWTFMREGEQEEIVSLPHTTRLEPLTVNDQWQGISYYRKQFDIANYSKDKVYLIEFEAAMNKVKIWVNGQLAKTDQGGYLPTVFDATPYLQAKNNEIKVELDNRDNAVTGPKPLAFLDFNMYGGLYRNAWIIEKNKMHISHASLVNEVAGGGIFITFPKVGKELSTVKVKTHIVNQNKRKAKIEVVHSILKDGEVIAKSMSKASVAGNKATYDTQSIDLTNPSLWSPSNPSLYTLETRLLSNGTCIDSESTHFGVREFTFVDNQVHINGEKTYLRGVNRHQEYPFVGYALSDNAQYRDAYKIKQAGFDFVRLSHYPHSPAFMHACDELGLVVLDAVLGWQYYPNEAGKKFFPDLNEQTRLAFDQHLLDQARRLVRRDRNHACVLAWEVSLNETQMPIEFMEMMHKTVKEEYPEGNAFTCGWKPEVYDIYLQARQHRLGHPEEITFEKPYIVSEYGDWEYYSSDAGLNQHNLDKSKRYEMSSRQARAYGEKRLLQQAYNLQEAYNDNMNIPATGDGYWVMYDYNRGYHNDIEYSGIMDIFRLPKFAERFYASQRDMTAAEDCVINIANFWTAESPTDVIVYSNAEKVSLYLNDSLIARQTPDKNINTINLPHAPFTFKVGKFEPGFLRATASSNGKKVGSDIVRTPGELKRLKIWMDESNRPAEAGCNDVLFVYIAGVDAKGTIVPNFTEQIKLQLPEGVELMNTEAIVAELGIATALVRIGNKSGEFIIKASSESKKMGHFKLNAK